MRSGLTGFFLAAALIAIGAGWRAGPGTGNIDVATPPASGQAPLYYARYYVEAIRQEQPLNALNAARSETDIVPWEYGAWQRRALAAARTQGQPDRESLRALIRSYELAPYPTPADMAWRVEFAAAYWPMMPDSVHRLTLTQMNALAGIPETWPKRKEWCRSLPQDTLAEVACESVPGTWRNGVQW